MKKAPVRSLILIVAILAALGAAAVLAVLWLGGERDAEIGKGPAAASAVECAQAPPLGATVAADSSEASEPVAPDAAQQLDDALAAVEALEPSGIYIAGRVIDKVTREAVTRFGIHLEEPDGPGTRIYRELDDTKGRFFIPIDSGGDYSLSVFSSCHRSYRRSEPLHVEAALADLCIELDPGLSVAGRVVDAAGNPVAGAIVGCDGWCSLQFALFGKPQIATHVFSNEKGAFTLAGLQEESATIFAVHPDRAIGVVKTAPGAADLEIVLRPGLRIFGTVRDDHGAPCPGIMITAMESETGAPIERPVLSGPDGRYRTDALKPGRVHLCAAAGRLGGAPRDVDFTEEFLVVLLEDGDREVDFGPAPGHVTWRGRLSDGTGLSMEGASLGLQMTEYFTTAPAGIELAGCYRTVRVAEDGRFEACKLLPGRYQAFVAAVGSRFNLEEQVFERAGVVERDIFFPGGAIRGRIVDQKAQTGAKRRAPWVVATDESGGRTMSSPDERGAFVFRFLPAGTYTLSADVFEGDRRTASVPGIEVVEGGVVDGVQVVIPAEGMAGGYVRVTVSGFAGFKEGSAGVLLVQKGGRRRLGSALQGPDAQGNFSRIETQVLQEGPWEARITIDGFGNLVRPFAVVRGQTVDLLVDRSDFQLYEGTGVVEGTVAFADGAPAAGARVGFRGIDLLGLKGPEGDEPWLEARADDEGCFEGQGFRPGWWSTHVELAGGGAAAGPYVEIPESAAGPVQFDIVLAQGVITGTLVDDLTGLPFAADGSKWRILAADKGAPPSAVRSWSLRPRRDGVQGFKAAALDEPRTGACFQVAGVEEGEYTLCVAAEGYFTYHSETPFQVNAGERLDLGAIRLKPCGRLIAEITDPAGAAVPHACAEFPELPDLAGRLDKVLSRTRCRFTDLPLGPTQFYVRAEGFESRVLTVNLRHGQVEEVRVILEPKK